MAFRRCQIQSVTVCLYLISPSAESPSNLTPEPAFGVNLCERTRPPLPQRSRRGDSWGEAHRTHGQLHRRSSK